MASTAAPWSVCKGAFDAGTRCRWPRRGPPASTAPSPSAGRRASYSSRRPGPCTTASSPQATPQATPRAQERKAACVQIRSGAAAMVLTSSVHVALHPRASYIKALGTVRSRHRIVRGISTRIVMVLQLQQQELVKKGSSLISKSTNPVYLKDRQQRSRFTGQCATAVGVTSFRCSLLV